MKRIFMKRKNNFLIVTCMIFVFLICLLSYEEKSIVVFAAEKSSDTKISNGVSELETAKSKVNTFIDFQKFVNQTNNFLSSNINAASIEETRMVSIQKWIISSYNKYINDNITSVAVVEENSIVINDEISKVINLKATIEKISKLMNKDYSEITEIRINSKNKKMFSLTISDNILKLMLTNKIKIVVVKDIYKYEIPYNFASGSIKYKLQISTVKESNEYTSYYQIGNSHIIKLIGYNANMQGSEKGLSSAITVTIPISEIGDNYYEYVKAAHKDVNNKVSAYDNFVFGEEKIIGKLSRSGKYFLYLSKEIIGNEENDEVATFKDIENHWAKDYIMKLVKEGITTGITKDKFAPGDNVTRAQAAVFMVKTCNLKLNDNYKGKFKDVQNGRWYTKYIETAADNGIINGYANGTFNPSGNLTRQEMIVMIMKAYEKNTGITLTNIVGDKHFKDEAKIPNWAKSCVIAAANLELIAGDKSGNFNPNKSITRAEVSKIIATYLEKVRTL